MKMIMLERLLLQGGCHACAELAGEVAYSCTLLCSSLGGHPLLCIACVTRMRVWVLLCQQQLQMLPADRCSFLFTWPQLRV